jgi:hypothetical protein
MSKIYFSDNKPIEGLGLASDIKAINDVLQQNGHCALPDDYVDFLYKTNGLLSNSFSLFGTRPQELAQGEHEEDILSATFKAEEEDIIEKDEYNSDIVLGRTSGGMLVIYSDNNKHYHVTEESTGESIYEYQKIEGFIADWSNPCPIQGEYVAPS